MSAVLRKELRAALGNMSFAVAAAVMLLIFGLMFRYYNLYNGALTYHYTVSSSVLLFYIAVPVLTMRSFADERKQKTDQLLLTSPLRPAEIVLGKFLAVALELLVPTLIAAFYPLIMLHFQTEQVRETLGWDYATLLMFFLMGCAYLAIGLFISALTENVIIAAIGTLLFIFASQMLGSIYTILSMSRVTAFIFLLILVLLAAVLLYILTHHLPVSAIFGALLMAALAVAFYLRPGLFDGRTESVLRLLDFASHFQNTAGGVFTLSDIAYFISWIVLGNVLTVRAIQRRRWDTLSKEHLANGSFAAAGAAITTAAVLVANLIVGALPSAISSFDLSGQKLYSVGSITKGVLDALEQDVTLYLMSESGQEDEPVEKLVESYAAYSPHVQYERIDAVAQPTFSRQYTDASVPLNSVIAVCGDEAQVADYSLFYQYDSYYAQTPAAFDAEGQITSAIARVTSGHTAKLYYTDGHDEVAMSDGMKEACEKSNISYEAVNLLSSEIPADADMLLVFAPSTDFTEAEGRKLRWYLDNGGHALIVTMPREVTGNDTLVLDSVLAAYGLTRSGKLVMEADENAYVQAPYLILPSVANAEVTAGLQNQNIVYALPEAVYTADTDEAVFSIQSLLLSSAGSYGKDSIGASVQKEEGDESGPFVLGACVEQTLSADDMGEPDVILSEAELSEDSGTADAEDSAERTADTEDAAAEQPEDGSRQSDETSDGEEPAAGGSEGAGIMRLLYFTSPCLFSADALSTLIQQYTALPEGNAALFANALSYLTDQELTVSVEAKSLAVPQTVIGSGVQLILGNVLMLLLPALVLAVGIVVWRRRLKR